MNLCLPALLITAASTRQDPALQTRGDRKLLVTELFPAKEEPAAAAVWQAPTDSGKCPVQVMRDTEVAVFTQAARQMRHCHKQSTQFYTVLEGRMSIEVEGSLYHLAPGDLLVVNPGALHEVRRQGEFLCRVITVNCGGAADKFAE